MKKSLGLYTLIVAACFFSICVAQESNTATNLKITEFMYKGNGHEFFELTNLGHAPIDMTDWSYDDESQNPDTVDLTDLGIIEPGESVILTTDDEEDFIDDWNLTDVKVMRYSSGTLGTNDQINIYSNTDQLIDCLTFGKDDFPLSINAKYHSAFPVTADVGTDNIYRWLLSRDNDVHNSYPSDNGDIGNPGFVKFIMAQKDLGYQGPGDGQFWVYGPKIATGNRVDVLLRQASMNQVAFLLLGLQNNPTSKFGGTFVPVPWLISVPMITIPSERCHTGEIYFKTDCGGGPVLVYAQFVYVDPNQCQGYGFSNALELDINP